MNDEPTLLHVGAFQHRRNASAERIFSLQVRDMTGDGAVVKRRIRDGRGEFPVDCPIEDSSVRVHYRCNFCR